MSVKAVSTWSLHRTLGSLRAIDPVTSTGVGASSPAPTSGLSLLDLPAELQRRGFDAVQICHFHLPTRSVSYLVELRAALAESSVTLDAVLIDDGDLIHPDDPDTHYAWISGWIDDAITLGARRTRVIAGRATPTPARLAASAQSLSRLVHDHPDIQVVTENWLELLPDAASVQTLLNHASSDLGLLIDLGNWTGPGKYAELAAVAGSAETCHAKCHDVAGRPDDADYQRSLQVLLDAGFTGPLALVYDGPAHDEWSALERQYAVTCEVYVPTPASTGGRHI